MQTPGSNFNPPSDQNFPGEYQSPRRHRSHRRSRRCRHPLGCADSSRVADFYVMIKTCLETVCIFLGVLCTHRWCLSTVSCEGRSDIAQLFSQFCLFFPRVAWKVLVVTQQIRGHKLRGQSWLRFDVTSERLHVCWCELLIVIIEFRCQKSDSLTADLTVCFCFFPSEMCRTLCCYSATVWLRTGESWKGKVEAFSLVNTQCYLKTTGREFKVFIDLVKINI